MKQKSSSGKIALAVCFTIFIAVVGLKSFPLTGWANVFHLFQKDTEESGQTDQGQSNSNTIATVKASYGDTLWLKYPLIDLNGTMAKGMKQTGNYSYMHMYALNGNYIISAAPKVSTDYEYNEMVSFKKFLDEKGINLLYVNNPTKYLDDNVMAENFGVQTYVNQNADLLLKRLKKAGINTLDLRKNIVDENLNIYDMFYRTDHHWNMRTGLWATDILAKSLNQTCGYKIDTDIYNIQKFDVKKYEDAWLGEQGRKISKAYTGLDDYVLVKPKYETSLWVKNSAGSISSGSFDILYNYDCLNTEADVYTTPSWHYAAMPQKLDNGTFIHNNNVKGGNVLLLCDSFAYSVVPYLALGVENITTVIPRGYQGNIRELIEKNDFDTVVVMYVEKMIGAHDGGEGNANYKMFMLD